MCKTLEDYIKSKKMAWSPTTCRSEYYRLKKHIGALDVEPEMYYKIVSKRCSPYSTKTLFIRLGEWESFSRGTDRYKQFIKRCRNLFKNAYKKERIELTYDQVEEKIGKIADQHVRDTAHAILRSGIRSFEMDRISNGILQGKGGKFRPIFSDIPERRVSYSQLYRSLKSVGLKPHTLRKVFITRLLEQGIGIKDVAYIAGHSNIQTTMRYAQPKKDSELKREIQEALNATHA